MNSIGLTESFNSQIIDNRNHIEHQKFFYPILRILNGEFRLSHTESNLKSFFEEIFSSPKVPDFRTLVYYFNRNPKSYLTLEKKLFENAIILLLIVMQKFFFRRIDFLNAREFILSKLIQISHARCFLKWKNSKYIILH
jgi:hypothetical protein